MSDLWTDPSLNSSPPTASDSQWKWLAIAAIVTIILWQMPFGNYILYPFTILATWFHEMGHGLTAILLGGDFQRLVLFANGSGIAIHSGVRFLGPLGDALVSAGGPMGPPLAGAALIMASRYRQTTRYGLLILGTVLVISTLIWVRSLLGWLVIPLIGAAILAIAVSPSRGLQAFTIQFLGMQACISSYHQLNYLFTYRVVIGGQSMLSDTGQMAQRLLLPHWVWGSIMAIASVIILVQSLRWAYRPH